MEIERKYLVKKEIWETIEKPKPQEIVQAYLFNELEKTLRVRIKGEKAFLTLKGKTEGISRSEFEYAIPMSDAKAMIKQFSEKLIEKNRYEIKVGNHLWEVDEFHGKLNGLLLAEIELSNENETFELPNWVGEEVSEDPNYYNANLIKKI